MIRSYYCHSLIDNVSLLNGLSCAVVFTEDFIHGGLIESIFTVFIIHSPKTECESQRQRFLEVCRI